MPMRSMRVLPPVAVGLVSFLPLTAGAQTTYVAPPGLDTVDGNSLYGYPFEGSVAGAGIGYRFQQVYGASAFASLHGPQYITELRFRVDRNSPTGMTVRPVTYSDFSVDLSTTGKAPDALSTTFDDNLGADLQTVYSGPYSFFSSSAYRPPSGSGPLAFDVVVPLSKPFVYDPSKGNLLLQVRMHDAIVEGYAPYLDAVNTTGDALSSISSNTDGGARTAMFSNSYGAVTQFVVANQTVKVKPTFDVLASSGDHAQHFTLTDGGDSINTQYYPPANVDRRGILGYDLSSVPKGAIITDASISFDINTYTYSPGEYPQVRLYAYTDNGVADVTDAANLSNLIATGDPLMSLGPTTISLDPNVLQSLLADGSRLGITALGSANGQQFGFSTTEFDPALAPALSVTYVVPEPAALTVAASALLLTVGRRKRAAIGSHRIRR